MQRFDFIRQMLGNPMLAVSTVLTLGVILVNGAEWVNGNAPASKTDAGAFAFYAG